jgi:nanoRNase/pAp phosphatase (c-di-AMP/oligoRNAs hydrolase)
MVWALSRDGMTVNVSMYHDAHSQLIDLSKIAKDYGGGGHPGACGFRIPLITWVPLINEGARSLWPSGSNADENQTVR